MATASLTLEDRSLSIGRVFSRAFSVMGKHPRIVLGTAFLLGALPQLLASYVTAGLWVDLQQRGVIVGIVGLYIISLFVMLVFHALVQGVIAHTAVVDREGDQATFAESVRYALSRALPLIAVGVLFGLAAVLGLGLLVVPFFFVATRWAVAPAAVVAERIGIGAFSRSAELTAGARWKILGLGILVVLVVWLIAAVAGVISISVSGVASLATGTAGLNPIVLAVNAITNTIIAAWWAAMQASLYIELRDWKDGPSTDRLAEIFR